MTGLRDANLVLRFLLEVAALVSLGYWGFSTQDTLVTKILCGIGAPLVAAVIWGLFVAPKAAHPVRLPWRLLIEAIVFGAAAAGLFGAGRSTLGWVFLALVLISEVLLLVTQG